jgi:hypothetical protein
MPDNPQITLTDAPQPGATAVI